MNNKGMFYTNVSDYETKEDMMNDFIALRMYDMAKDKEIERQKEIIRQLDIKNLELTTIINKLEEYMRSDDGWDVENILNYLQELKGSDKE